MVGGEGGREMRRSAIGWVVFNDSLERNQFDGETKRWMKYDLLQEGGLVEGWLCVSLAYN